MIVQFMRATALYPYGYFVQWSIPAVDPNENGPITFELFRSGGPIGPWEPIVKGSDKYAHADKFNAIPSTLDNLQPNQMRFFQQIYYRIVATLPSGKTIEAIETTGFKTRDRKMAQYLRKSQRDFRLSLKFNGTPVMLLKKRRWGLRCEVCYDRRTKEVVRPNCKVCWGTGFKEGYWTPLLTYARRGVSPNTVAITPAQKADSYDANFWLPDFPAIERDDIIVSLADQNRFRADVQIDTEIQLTSVHQEVTCQQIPHDNIIYKLRVSPDTSAPLF
jgi:hypothetical protein